MQLTVLGRYGAYPAKRGACSGYLLEQDETRVLLDCGSGVFSRLQSYTSLQDLDALIITHFHSDHYLDVYPIRYALQLSQLAPRKDKLPLLLPPGGQGELVRIFDTEQSQQSFLDCFDCREFGKEPISLGGIKLSFLPAAHPIPSYGVKAEGRGSFVYTGDTSFTPSLVNFCQGIDMLLAECTLRNQDREKAKLTGHMTAGEAGLLGREAGVKQLMLTHFWPEFSLDQYSREAEEQFKNPPLIAEEMVTYIVSP